MKGWFGDGLGQGRLEFSDPSHVNQTNVRCHSLAQPIPKQRIHRTPPCHQRRVWRQLSPSIPGNKNLTVHNHVIVPKVRHHNTVCESASKKDDNDKPAMKKSGKYVLVAREGPRRNFQQKPPSFEKIRRHEQSLATKRVLACLSLPRDEDEGQVIPMPDDARQRDHQVAFLPVEAVLCLACKDPSSEPCNKNWKQHVLEAAPCTLKQWCASVNEQRRREDCVISKVNLSATWTEMQNFCERTLQNALRGNVRNVVMALDRVVTALDLLLDLRATFYVLVALNEENELNPELADLGLCFLTKRTKKVRCEATPSTTGPSQLQFRALIFESLGRLASECLRACISSIPNIKQELLASRLTEVLKLVADFQRYHQYDITGIARASGWKATVMPWTLPETPS